MCVDLVSASNELCISMANHRTLSLPGYGTNQGVAVTRTHKLRDKLIHVYLTYVFITMFSIAWERRLFIVEGARAGSTRDCKVAHASSFAESAIILGRGNWWDRKDRYIGSIVSALKKICMYLQLRLLTFILNVHVYYVM